MNKLTFRSLFLGGLIGIILLTMGLYVITQIFPRERSFEEYLLSDDVNDTIRLYRNPFSEYPFKLGYIINLGVINRSNEIVVFPWDEGIRLFLFKDGNWIRVVDSVERLYSVRTGPNTGTSRKILPTDLFYLPPKGVAHNGGISSGTRIVSALPSLTPSEIPTMLRFMVIGTIYRNGLSTNEQVIAYIDIKIVR